MANWWARKKFLSFSLLALKQVETEGQTAFTRASCDRNPVKFLSVNCGDLNDLQIISLITFSFHDLSSRSGLSG